MLKYYIYLYVNTDLSISVQSICIFCEFRTLRLVRKIPQSLQVKNLTGGFRKDFFFLREDA